MKLKVVIALLLVSAALPLAAQGRDVQLTVFFSRAQMQGDNDFDGFSTDFEDGTGYGASANFFFGDHFSVEAAVFSLRSETGLQFEDQPVLNLGNMNMTPISIGGQFHILGKRRFDPYIGAGAAYVLGDDLLTEDLEFAGIGRIEVESDIAYYFNAGIGVQISEGFGVVLDARQLQYEPNSRSSVTGVEQDLDLSPRILSAGLRLRF